MTEQTQAELLRYADRQEQAQDMAELLRHAEHSMRRVLKAEWTAGHYYCLALECGHHMHGSESYLRSPVLCIACVKEKMQSPVVAQ